MKTVDEADHVTDPKRRQMKLPPSHDVRESGMINRYRASPDYATLEPIPEKLSAEGLVFSWYHSQALFTWAQIEDLLFRIFSGLLRCEQRSAAAAFYSLMHFNQKLKTTDAIAKVELDGATLKSWSKLQGRLWKANDKRNLLAHHGSMYVTSKTGETTQTLTPSMYAAVSGSRSGSMPKKEELEDTWRSFQKLQRDLTDFANQCGFALPIPQALLALIKAFSSQGGSD